MMWKIPLADVKFGPEEFEAVTRVMSSGWVTMGPETELFEHEFAAYVQTGNALAVSSCTTALHLALASLGIKAGDEVIVPSLTFVASANAILYVGAVPVFADVVGPNDWNISPQSIREKITPRTKAIIVVHYAGFPCRMDEIMEIAKENGLKVIEDAAHAPGASFMGKKLGTIGDVGCFSFFANKNLTTAEGGMVVTDNVEISDRIRILRSHGMTSLTWDRHKGHCFSYDVVETGFNYRIDEIRAALGRVQLSKLDEGNLRRKEATRYMRHLFAGADDVSIPFSDDLVDSSSCHIFPVFLSNPDSRPGLMERLKRAGIQSSIHYPPIHKFSVYKQFAGSQNLEVTETIAAGEVTLPLFPQMSPQQMDAIADEVKGCLSANNYNE